MAPIRRPDPNTWDLPYVRDTSVEALVEDAIAWDRAHRTLLTVSSKLWFPMTWPDPDGPGTYHLRVIGHGMLNTQARLVLRVSRNIWDSPERLTRALRAVKRLYLCKVPDTDGYDPDMDEEPTYDNKFDEYDSDNIHADARNPLHAWN